MFKLTRYKTESKDVPTIRVVCEATDPDVSSAIFVFHAMEFDYNNPQSRDKSQDMYSNVASLQDMNIIPENDPKVVENDDGTKTVIPFYRLSDVTLDFYNMDQAERWWNIVLYDVDFLIRSYKASRKLNQDEIIILDN